MSAPLIDGFGRQIDYVRLSVTDRCDLRCRYCMPEAMTFLPRADLLTLEELVELARHFVRRGVRRIRLTGGEPLVRKNVEWLASEIGGLIGHGLAELTLTTNGTLLAGKAAALHAAGVRRINVSLDSLDAERFAAITRRDVLPSVIEGLDAARGAGLAVRINTVAMRGVNGDEIGSILRWCGEQGFDLCLIETMPLGSVDDNRTDRFLPLTEVEARLAEEFTLTPSAHRTAGPARYFDVRETCGRLGLITPLTSNFCAGCNRVRVTATGTVFGCLGHDQRIEFRDILRDGREADIDRAFDLLLAGKPRRHDFDQQAARPAVARHMSVTGG